MDIKNKIGKIVYKDISELENFQGDLKTLTKVQAEKLKASIKRHGNIAPVFIWGSKILDGVQRTTIMKDMGMTEKIACVEIMADDEKEAKEILLQLSSAHGYIEDDKLHEFIETAGLDFEILKLEISPVNIRMETFEMCYYKDEQIDVIEGEQGNSNLDHFYQGNSRGFRLGDLMCYITDEKLIAEMNEFTKKIIEVDEDQRYLNSIGETMVRYILKNETLFLQK